MYVRVATTFSNVIYSEFYMTQKQRDSLNNANNRKETKGEQKQERKNKGSTIGWIRTMDDNLI
jgi:hypothetical protein